MTAGYRTAEELARQFRIIPARIETLAAEFLVDSRYDHDQQVWVYRTADLRDALAGAR